MMLRGLIAALFVGQLLNAQAQASNEQWLSGLKAYWEEINAEYSDPMHSPLLDEDRSHFTELERFEPNSAFAVTAQFKAKQGKEFGMKTSTDRVPIYQSVGRLSFKINGKKYKLTAYRNVELGKQEEYANYYFVPFTDLTNGDETYGGGRYIDLEGPFEKNVALDFNRAYNPYCAYNAKYSCPVPPSGNHLDIKVLAGVKLFHE